MLPLDDMKGDTMTPIEEAQKAVREWDEGKHCHWDSRAYVDVIRGLLCAMQPLVEEVQDPRDALTINWVLDPTHVQDVYVADKVIYVRQNDRLYYLENKKLWPVMM